MTKVDRHFGWFLQSFEKTTPTNDQLQALSFARLVLWYSLARQETLINSFNVDSAVSTIVGDKKEYELVTHATGFAAVSIVKKWATSFKGEVKSISTS